MFGFIRQNFGMPDTVAVTDRSPVDLDEFYRQDLADRLTHDPDGRAFFQEHNPVVRHTVLRRRRALEEAGLMKPVAVDLHPRDDEPDRRTRAFFGATGKAVIATIALQDAFKVADAYTSALMSRNKGAGFLKSLLLQRILFLLDGRAIDDAGHRAPLGGLRRRGRTSNRRCWVPTTTTRCSTSAISARPAPPNGTRSANSSRISAEPSRRPRQAPTQIRSSRCCGTT
ncbi:hypothetical protein [Siccirubricoccus sp. G192]|uniref:hypothetical protein n=1 Tax=Siccirubricoccus sp. G192 TaxID=2849651 RepID=UPI0020C20C74|nr:hypothetical protein [Siccirubricoccus sp. G192]